MPVARKEDQGEVLWIDTGIIAIPLLDRRPLSSECVGFGPSFRDGSG